MTELLDRAEYDRFRVAPADPATLRQAHVEAMLKKLVSSSNGRLKSEKFAESAEDRAIYLATIGTGPRSLLLWTQMHGDEPTHTAVVLDLLSYLLQTPAKPQAADMLKSCTLHIIPMLNPDGAEAVTRFNAQGIDINRDARRLASPEARALQKAVDTIKPQFGFNLHNQHARTSVGNPPRPAVVSVLAPPPDADRTETPAMRQAKQMCATFVEAVRPYAEGKISRYDDTFEPRAFGDTIQSLGTATMLVEAGGWHEADPEPLTRLHFHGMLTTLHAIATDSFRNADIKRYETLPQSNSFRLFDSRITGGYVLDPKFAQPFRADLGIEQSRGDRLAVTRQRDGRITEIGDLSTLTGKQTFDAAGQLILPGRIAFLSDWSPTKPLDGDTILSLLARGVTAVLGVVDLADGEAIDAVGRARELPMNWGFVGQFNGSNALSAGESIERAVHAAAQGVLAVIGPQADEELWQHLDYLKLPLLQSKQLQAQEPPKATYRELIEQNWNMHTALNLHARRGRVARDYFADLQCFEAGTNIDVSQAVNWHLLKRVIVAGDTVWDDGKRTGDTWGVLLRHN